MTEGLLEYLQVAGRKAYDVCYAACKLLFRREIMIIEFPDHTISHSKVSDPSKDKRCIVTSKPKAITHHCFNIPLLRFIKCKVEPGINFRIIFKVIDSGGYKICLLYTSRCV